MSCSKVLWELTEIKPPIISQQLSQLLVDLKSCFKEGGGKTPVYYNIGLPNISVQAGRMR